MIYKYLIFMTLMVSISCLSAQDATEFDYSEVAYSKLTVGLSSEPFGMEAKKIVGSILDDSPSGDWLFIDVDLSENQRAFGGNVGFEKSYSNRLVWNIEGNFMSHSEGQAASLGVGIGYQIGNRRFHIVPMLRTGLGGGKIELGNIVNESAYIQFDDEKFYGSYMTTHLRGIYGYVESGLNMTFAISKGMGLQLSASYKLSRNVRTDVVFEGWEDSGNSVEGKTHRALSHERNNVLADGEAIEENGGLINFRGLAFRISYMKYLNFSR